MDRPGGALDHCLSTVSILGHRFVSEPANEEGNRHVHGWIPVQIFASFYKSNANALEMLAAMLIFSNLTIFIFETFEEGTYTFLTGAEVTLNDCDICNNNTFPKISLAIHI